MKQDQAGPPLTTRSAGQRRFWSSEEKRRMVAESFALAASVSKVAQARARRQPRPAYRRDLRDGRAGVAFCSDPERAASGALCDPRRARNRAAGVTG
jgi:hypothetical protein